MALYPQYKIRCEDCPNRKTENGVWKCKECFGQLCSDIDDCPDGMTAEEIIAIEERAKENKIKLVAKANDEKKPRKPREIKEDPEKIAIIQKIFDSFSDFGVENLVISNKSKVVEFDKGGEHYKIDLIRQRKPKK